MFLQRGFRQMKNLQSVALIKEIDWDLEKQTKIK